VGFVFEHNVGSAVTAGEVVATVHARDEKSAEAAVARLMGAITVGDEAPAAVPLLHERIG
jgi:thymidine phosphorylase